MNTSEASLETREETARIKQALAERIAEKEPILSSLFEKAEIRIEGKTFLVRALAGTIALMKLRKVPEVMSAYFHEQGLPYEVSLEEAREEIKNTEPSVPNAIGKSAPDSIMKRASDSIMKSAREKEEKEPAFTALKEELSEEEEEFSFGGGNEASAKRKNNQVLIGRPIVAKNLLPLERCDEERRGITVRGIVSQSSIYEYKPGRGVLSFRLTDYRHTVSVKAFVVMKTYREKLESSLTKGSTVLVRGNLLMDSYEQDLVLNASSVTLSAEDMPVDEAAKEAAEMMIIGQPFEGEAASIAELLSAGHTGNVILEADILASDSREVRGSRVLVSADVTDYTDSVSVRFYMDAADYEQKSALLKKGRSLRIRGLLSFEERYAHAYQVFAECVGPLEASVRKLRRDDGFGEDRETRIELHAHTKMSEMDAVISPAQLVQRAAFWGHKAVAVTDHGAVQGFSEAMDAAKKHGVKVLYGMEAYVVDDSKEAVTLDKGQSFSSEYVVFDIETTGFSKEKDQIIEIGAVKVREEKIVERFSEFVNPKHPIPEHITKLTSITDEDVASAGTIEEVLPRFLRFIEGAVLVAHNAPFDTGFIANKAVKIGETAPDNTIVDTLEMSRGLYDLRRYTLDSVAKHLGVELKTHHRAVDDAEATCGIFLRILKDLKEQGIETLGKINAYIREHVDVRRLRPHHAVLLVQNMTGLKHLYELVSLSHLSYFYFTPRIPKSELTRLREGLLIGSACSNGELFEAVMENESQDVLERIVSFFDYLEIQPVANHAYLIGNESHGSVSSEEELREINARIVELGEMAGKPVVATSDAHFLDPEDEIFRRILRASKKMRDADEPMPLFFRTTEEMMAEFSYLGEKRAYDVVIRNPRVLAESICDIRPIPDGQFPPKLPHADEELRSMCLNQAKSLYGDPLPESIENRLERELDCIIRNGFASLYILASRLVQHSLSDGYHVGSRGSVGSSLAATMAGITEVNPLPAHYYCPSCHYTDLDPVEARGHVGLSGYDLPPKKCPVCQSALKRDGQDCPFEVFLGFDGNKEPDIDLNFSGEYQAKAHAYVEEMLGKDHVYRAGTMSGIASKTAYGMARHYLEERNLPLSDARISYLVNGILDVKRTTGQHPGGQIVVPDGYSIFDFTPVQHPANDMNTPIITTHFDYDQLHGRLLKLDILGHDDPTMVRMLEDMTGTVAKEVPLDDPKVMSLFVSTEALGVTPEQIGSEVGTYGISEFGTHFVRQMLVDTRPESFSDLVRISGLSHGTDVWNNNAKDIIAGGIAPFASTICTREDIMLGLISRGMDSLDAFRIMETVRNGKKKGGLKAEDIELMVSHGVEPWYLESCKKIQYLFPRSHAVAYVTMSLRIAYYKVYHKEAYYAAFFTIRADSFDYEKMALGEARAREEKDKIEAKPIDERSAKEKEVHTLLELVIEFYARGLEFLPIDLYRSHAHAFQIAEGKLLPPFDTISGMGEIAARSITDARENGEFVTQTDLLERTKLSRTIVETMQTLGILGDMPETDQLSLF